MGLDRGALFGLQRCQLDKLGFLWHEPNLIMCDERKPLSFADIVHCAAIANLAHFAIIGRRNSISFER